MGRSIPAIAQTIAPQAPSERLTRPISESGRRQELIGAYHASLVDWGRIVRSRVRPVPDRPGELFIGRPGNVENDVRPTAYAAMVLSFLAETDQPNASISDSGRSEMREEAAGLLRYLAFSHVSNGGTCVNGKPWGNGWQSAMWARAVGFAAWQSWSSLDESLQAAVSRLLFAEADRFINARPKSSVRNDTGAEENAWNASITSLVCNMFPNHPHARAWETAAKRYMYNTFSVAADATDDAIGDDGLPIRSWVTTVNAHDDFTVENHGLVHVGYLKNSLTLLLENAVHWKLVDKNPPSAYRHHVPEVFDRLCRCMNWNAAAIYFGGNDWRIYDTQCSDILIYTALRQFVGNRHAAYLEEVALEHLLRRQRSEGGYYNGRRDLEYGGMCATRLISCYSIHVLGDSLTLPATDEQFGAIANGVTRLDAARSVLHRTPDKFASFSWAQKRMALAIPSEDSSVVWPHFTSYTGVINAEQSSDRYSPLRNLRINTGENDFSVSGTLVRCKGTLLHDFFYSSPAGALTLYAERLQPQTDFQLQYRKTGIVGLDYAIGNNQRQLHGDFGTVTAIGVDGPKQTIPLKSRWLNIDDRIGYVVCRSDDRDNVMLYHAKNRIDPRRPHLQESIALISEDAEDKTLKGHWACVVTLLNQTADQTRAMAEKIQLNTTNAIAKVDVDGERFVLTTEPE